MLLLTALSASLCGLLSCSGDSPGGAAEACPALTADCSAPVPTYVGTVQAIIDLRCGSCHRADNPSGPWPLDNYEDVADWSLVISNQLDSCMIDSPHFGNPLPDGERRAIDTWLGCGVPEN